MTKNFAEMNDQEKISHLLELLDLAVKANNDLGLRYRELLDKANPTPHE